MVMEMEVEVEVDNGWGWTEIGEKKQVANRASISNEREEITFMLRERMIERMND